jgi:hypothetical protein
MRPLPQPPRQNCPVGATFSEPSLRKSVATLMGMRSKETAEEAEFASRIWLALGWVSVFEIGTGVVW